MRRNGATPDAMRVRLAEREGRVSAQLADLSQPDQVAESLSKPDQVAAEPVEARADAYSTV